MGEWSRFCISFPLRAGPDRGIRWATDGCHSSQRRPNPQRITNRNRRTPEASHRCASDRAGNPEFFVKFFRNLGVPCDI